MSYTVDVSSEGLGDLSRALTKKRLDCVKLNETLNAPPRGLSDLMAQSRAFTDKLMHLLEDGSELSDAIKNELTDDNGFPGQVHRMPLEGAYDDIERVKEELRVSDGYQPYIVAPENGLRKLFENSMEKLANPVRDLVDTVHGIVMMAAEKAMQEACQVPSVERGPPVVRFPRFQEHILPVAEGGLEELKEDAMKMALKIVEMEKDFVSCSFFRYLTYKRIHEQEEAQKRRDQEGSRRKGRRHEDDDDEDEEDDDDGGASVTETEVSLPPVLLGESIPNVYSDPDQVFGLHGYLQKSSTRSRNKITQFESSLWQRRFFGVKDSARTLEYYYSEDTFLKGAQPSVVIPLADCVIEDTDGQGVLPQSTLSRSKDHLDKETQVSLLIFIQNKDPDKPIYKKSKDLILRAEDAADKYRWLSYLRNTSSDSRAGAKVATWSTRAVRKPSTASDTGVDSVQGRSGGDGGRGGFYVEDYAELTEGHGLGSAIFWDPICRDQNNGLLPSPGVFIDGDADLSMEKALIQHAADMKTYTRLSCETLVMTVPKVIVHCLVDRSTDKLGPIIEEYILRLPEETRELLLEEDASIAAHRLRVKDTINEIGKAQDTLKESERSMGASPTAKVDVSIIELAGLSARLKKNEEGVYIFINKPKPPNAKRNVTPERRKDNPPAPAPAQPPAQPQRQPYQGHPTAPPAVGGHSSVSRASNGTNQPAPRRPAPPVAPALTRSGTVQANGAVNGTSAQSQQPQQTSSSSSRSQQPKQPQSSSWYGFKPFGR